VPEERSEGTAGAATQGDSTGNAAERAFLEAIVEHIPDMIFVKDAAELRFVRMNRAGEELLGIPRDQLLGRRDADFFPASEAEFFTAADRRVLASPVPMEVPEEPIHTAASGLRWLRTKKMAIRDAEGRPMYLLGISEDITEWKAQQEQIARQAEELRRRNAELDRLAHVVGHELSQPLTTVTMLTDLLLEELRSRGDVRLARSAQDALQAATRMRALLRDLVDLGRAGHRLHRPTPVVMGELVAEVVQDLRALVLESGGTVEAAELPTVTADRTALGQVLSNLISNALKYRAERAPEIRVEARREGKQWVVSVRDNGIGIAAEDQPHLFESFTRLPAASRSPGAGLGLAICQRTIERLGGTLTVESEVGVGSVFSFTLPIHEGGPTG
jgi:PAS domain S-box-containing protein